MRSAVRPSVLLPDRDHVVRICRVDVQPGLFLRVNVESLARSWGYAGAERALSERNGARQGGKDSHAQRTGGSPMHRGEAQNERQTADSRGSGDWMHSSTSSSCLPPARRCPACSPNIDSGGYLMSTHASWAEVYALCGQHAPDGCFESCPAKRTVVDS